jgi:hypothetical protein
LIGRATWQFFKILMMCAKAQELATNKQYHPRIAIARGPKHSKHVLPKRYYCGSQATL